MSNAVRTIGIVGSGQMGRGIAQVAAQSGFSVTVFDLSEEALKFAEDFITKQLSRGVEKGKWDESHKKESLQSLNFVSKIQDLKNTELVIEAATENKEIKFKIFQQLEEIVSEKTILASNTSSISITELAGKLQKPERVCGMHFMNPVPVMKLVEGIKGLETSDEVFSEVEKVSQQMGKVFVKANDFPGFAVNRILMPMINEAVFSLQEGLASEEDIDQAMKLGCNFPMGPLELADFIGLDTCLSILEVLHEGLGDPKYRPCPLLKKYVLAGRMGRKSKRGFYTYE